jgi:hypothetical protein
MSETSLRESDAERLEALKAELFRNFGRFTHWKVLCRERGAKADEEKIRLAEEVLAAPSTATNAEGLTYQLRLNGAKSFDVDEMLARSEEPRPLDPDSGEAWPEG